MIITIEKLLHAIILPAITTTFMKALSQLTTIDGIKHFLNQR